MIEINGNPRRLDIDWRLVERAHDRGVRFSIHPDAHSIQEYNALISGTWAARKAGLSPADIFNTRPADEVADYLTSRSRASRQPRHHHFPQAPTQGERDSHPGAGRHGRRGPRPGNRRARRARLPDQTAGRE